MTPSQLSTAQAQLTFPAQRSSTASCNSCGPGTASSFHLNFTAVPRSSSTYLSSSTAAQLPAVTAVGPHQRPSNASNNSFGDALTSDDSARSLDSLDPLDLDASLDIDTSLDLDASLACTYTRPLFG